MADYLNRVEAATSIIEQAAKDLALSAESLRAFTPRGSYVLGLSYELKDLVVDFDNEFGQGENFIYVLTCDSLVSTSPAVEFASGKWAVFQSYFENVHFVTGSVASGGTLDYKQGTGFWSGFTPVGGSSDVYKAHLGDPTKGHLDYDGDRLVIYNDSGLELLNTQESSISSGVQVYDGVTYLGTLGDFVNNASTPTTNYIGEFDNFSIPNPEAYPINSVYKNLDDKNVYILKSIGGNQEWQLFLETGDRGQAQYKSTVFTRTTNPYVAPPLDSDGSFANPVPTEIIDGIVWSDGVPAGSNPLWMTTRIFTDDGLSPQQSSWTIPQKFGALGQGVQAEFSVDGVNWVAAEFATPDAVYMRVNTSIDGGETWVYGETVKIRGEEGNLTSFVFTRSVDAPGTPLGGTFENPIPIDSDPPGTVWSDGIPEGTAPLWMSTGVFQSDTVYGTWTAPQKVASLGPGTRTLFSNDYDPENTDPENGTWVAPENAGVNHVYMRVDTLAEDGETWIIGSPVLIKGEKGDTGVRGTITIYQQVSGNSWNNATYAGYTGGAEIAEYLLGTPRIADSVIFFNDGTTAETYWQEQRTYDGTNWIIVETRIDGNLLVDGTIVGDKLAANTVTASQIDATNLNVAAANITGELSASQIDTTNLTIKDASGNVIFGAGTNLDYSNVTGGPPSDADKTSDNVASGITDQGDFATLDKITATNVSTYIADAAIKTAQIDSLAVTNAKIADAAVETLKVAGNSITVVKSGTGSSITLNFGTLSEIPQSIVLFVYLQDSDSGMDDDFDPVVTTCTITGGGFNTTHTLSTPYGQTAQSTGIKRITPTSKTISISTSTSGGNSPSTAVVAMVTLR